MRGLLLVVALVLGCGTGSPTSHLSAFREGRETFSHSSLPRSVEGGCTRDGVRSNARWALGSKARLELAVTPTVCKRGNEASCTQWEIPAKVKVHQEPALLRIQGKADADVMVDVSSFGKQPLALIDVELLAEGHVRVTSNEASFDLDVVRPRSIDVALVSRVPFTNAFDGTVHPIETVPANGASIAGSSRVTISLRDEKGAILCGRQPLAISVPVGVTVTPDAIYGTESMLVNGTFVVTASELGDHHIAVRSAGIEAAIDIHAPEKWQLTSIGSSFRGDVIDLEYRVGTTRVFGNGWILSPEGSSPEGGRPEPEDASFHVWRPTHITGQRGLTLDVGP